MLTAICRRICRIWAATVSARPTAAAQAVTRKTPEQEPRQADRTARPAAGLKYPAAVIVFMTPLHRLTEDEPSMGNGLPLKAYVDIIKEVAQFYSIPVLDLYAMSGIQPRVPVQQEKYCPDGLHPNGEGHKLIASRLTGFLKSL